MSNCHSITACIAALTIGLFSSASSQAAATAGASIANINFSAVSLTGGTASYSFRINPSYPYTTPTTVGATVYDFDYPAPGAYDTGYGNTYTFLDNVSTTATSTYNEAAASVGTSFLSSEAFSQDQLSAAAVAATSVWVTPGVNGLEISPYTELQISYDIAVFATDDGLAIPANPNVPVWQQRPFESANAFVSVNFEYAGPDYWGDGWEASGFQTIGAFSIEDGSANSDLKSGHYSSWIRNLSDAPLFVGLAFRAEAEAYGGGVTPIPEPKTYILFLAGLVLLAVMVRRHSAAQICKSYR
jgi:hypothetical protein